MTGAEGNTSKLAHQVALLVGHGGAAVDGYGVLAIFVLDGAETLRDGVQHFIPGCSLQWAIFTMPAHQWVGKAVRMIDSLVSSSSLGAQHAMIQRKVFTRLYTYHFAICYFEIHAAL